MISVETARGRRLTLRTTCPRTAAPNTTSAPRRWSAALNYNSGAASSGACRSSPHVTTSAPLERSCHVRLGGGVLGRLRRQPFSPPHRYHYLKLTNYTRRLRKRQSICPCTTAPPATASSSPGGGVLEAEIRRSRRTTDH